MMNLEIKIYKEKGFWYVEFEKHIVTRKKDLMEAVATLDKCKETLNATFDAYEGRKIYLEFDKEKATMFLFARYMATHYADECNGGQTLSVLNIEDGEWWLKRLNHFVEEVLPEYIKNGTLKETIKFIKGEK